MKIELQDILEQYAEGYMGRYGVSSEQYKAINDIINCRTSELGGHIDECGECGHIEISYNSCRNRHCPKCQTFAKEKWIDARKEDLLPVPYFHIVFTVPEELNSIIYQNQKEIYSIFFRAVSETLSELASDPRYLGAQIGFTTILHTWGQNLMYHPHIHCIVPSGGLRKEGQFIKGKDKFFIPIRVLSQKFRGKFLAFLDKAYMDGKLKFHDSTREFENSQNFFLLKDSLFRKDWVVYCRETFNGPGAVIEYLGRYTHRVAISNNRILKLENDKVTFKWKDYRDEKEKIMVLHVYEFIRRFLMHVLPCGFMKIRHYGLLSNRNRNTKLRYCQKVVGYIVAKARLKDLCAVEILKLLTGKDVTICPSCGEGRMRTKQVFHKGSKSPPLAI